jgi:hypothetical protein
MSGTCEHCRKFLQNLKSHRCQVTKFREFDARSLTREDWYTCDGCRRVGFAKNKMRAWCGASLCVDCYRIPEIQQAQNDTGHWLRIHLLATGRACCAGCRAPLIDPGTAELLLSCELDHLDASEKVQGVGSMVQSGLGLAQIIPEADKCRALCVRCHAMVTRVEHKTGYTKFPPSVPAEIKKACLEKVEALVAELFRSLRPP